MPSNQGVSFPDASYNYHHGNRRPIVPPVVPMGDADAGDATFNMPIVVPEMDAQRPCGCAPQPCGCGCPTHPCEHDSDVPAYDCNCHEEIKYRLCCDPCGCCCKYPCSWRNPFWPEFAHPRWLCCKDLYNVRPQPCDSSSSIE